MELPRQIKVRGSYKWLHYLLVYSLAFHINNKTLTQRFISKGLVSTHMLANEIVGLIKSAYHYDRNLIVKRELDWKIVWLHG